MLAASIAIPGTLWLDRNNDASPASAADSTTQPQQPSDRGDGSFTFPETRSSGTDATDEQSQGVVLVNTVTPTGEGAGTGVVLSADGLVLTNYHVVEDSSTVKVTVATTGDTYDAEVLGHDQTADVALLQLDGAEDLATAKLDDDGTSPDDAVTAVGNAGGPGLPVRGDRHDRGRRPVDHRRRGPRAVRQRGGSDWTHRDRRRGGAGLLRRPVARRRE